MAPVLHGRRCIHAPTDLCVYGDLQPERRFYAHRLLLMCISPYFEKVFRYRPAASQSFDCIHCNSFAKATTSGVSTQPHTDERQVDSAAAPPSNQSAANQSMTGDHQPKGRHRPRKRTLKSNKENHQPQPVSNACSAIPQVIDNSSSSVSSSVSSCSVSSSSSTSSSVSSIRPSPTTSTLMMSCHSFPSAFNPFSTHLNPTLTKNANLLQICDCSSTTQPNKPQNGTELASSSRMPTATIATIATPSTLPTTTTTMQPYVDMPFHIPPPPDQPPEQLRLVGLDAQQVEALLCFAYEGQLSVDASNVQSFMHMSDMYNVKAMFDLCQHFLAKSLSVHNCVGVYVFAQRLQCAQLMSTAERFILRHFESVANRSAEFTRLLDADQLAGLLLQHRLYVSDEHLVFSAIVRWVQFDRLNRSSALARLFSCIRLALINNQQLLECVLAHSFISCQPALTQLVERVLRCKARLQQLGRPDEQVMCDDEIQTFLTPRFPLDLIFVFGGRTLDVEFVPPEPVVEVYDHRAERWKQVPVLQDSARDHHQTVVLRGEIYMLGGHSGPFQVFNSCRKYNFSTRKWTEVAPMKEKRAFLAAVVLNDCIYAIGGYNGAWRVDTAEVYNSKINQWQSIASMNERRSGAGAAVLNERIYVVGGFRDLTYLNTAEFYCPQSNTWTGISLMQKPRSSPAVVSLNGFVYAIGGLTAGGLLSSAERYDPASGSWTLLEHEMIERKCSAAAVVLEGKIFVIGGWNGVAGLDTIELWCPHTKRWLLGSKLAKRRTGCAACVVPEVPEIELYGWSAREELVRQRFLNSFTASESDA